MSAWLSELGTDPVTGHGGLWTQPQLAWTSLLRVHSLSGLCPWPEDWASAPLPAAALAVTSSL